MAKKERIQENATIGAGINYPDIRTVTVRLVGTSPLIMHRFGAKAQKMIDRTAEGKANAPNRKAPRDPQAECEDALILDEEGRFCAKGVWFKKGMMDVARECNLTGADVRRNVYVIGELIPLETPGYVMRTDMTRLAGMTKAPDLRYRPMFKEWALTLTIQFDANQISAQHLMNLLVHAGLKNGVGDWRPQKNGDFGRFAVDGEVASASEVFPVSPATSIAQTTEVVAAVTNGKRNGVKKEKTVNGRA